MYLFSTSEKTLRKELEITQILGNQVNCKTGCMWPHSLVAGSGYSNKNGWFNWHPSCKFPVKKTGNRVAPAKPSPTLHASLKFNHLQQLDLGQDAASDRRVYFLWLL